MRRPRLSTADKKFLKGLWKAAEDKLGVDPVMLDMRGLSPWMDFFFLVTGQNPPQRAALAEALAGAARSAGRPHPRAEGGPQDDWQVLNLGFVVAHIQSPEARTFYDLDDLWGDAPRLKP